MTPALTPEEALEALSRKYSLDTFFLRRLASGRWCLYGPDRQPIGAATTLEGIALLAQPLEALAAAARERFEAERAALTREAAAKREIASLDLSDVLDDLELDL